MWTRRQFLGRSFTGVAATALSLSEALAASESPRLSKTSPKPVSAPEHLSPLDAAHGVLKRQLGDRAADFRLRISGYPEDGHESYQIQAKDGVVDIAGTSAVALCRGIYSYLRERCGAMITWSGSHLELPARLPDQARAEVSCPYQHVQYFNPCTFGYTMAFWDWERWERELDWMALHGITMPLAMEGQEYVWQKVWASFGLSQSEIDVFNTGPAHLPWHRMGNINRFDGLLSQHWIEEHRLLQQKILDRMHSLGMKPVAPAFSGFVPQGFLRVHPEAETFTLLWLPKEFATIPRDTRTFILHPRQEELYRDIGRRFIETYKETYGEVQYYLADTFNELAVPVTEDRRYADLEQFGRTVYSGIQAGDPNGIWVMQGWLFVFDNFWDPASVEALLKGVPDDRMLILDYSNDLTSGLRDKYAPSPWKRFHAFYGKQWSNGMAHTFGGNDNVKGNLALMASEPAAVLASAEKGNLVAWSMCPEGIETNEVVYELMTDAGWRKEPIDLGIWIPAYCNSRYGACPSAMHEAWKLLLKSAYGAHIWMTKQAWQGEPSLAPAAASVDSGEDYVKAVTLYLSCASELGNSSLYRNDLIEFVGQAAGGLVDGHLAQATQAIRGKEFTSARDHADQALKMLNRIDAMTNLRPDRRLETWVDSARSKAATADEAASLDENARRLITTWGWSELSDYASRVWSGLIRDYYAARWRAWFDHQLSGSEFSLDIWQQSWLSRPYVPSTPAPVPDLIAEAQSIMATVNRSA
jgi:alpha-N-acetylglucosaminidase